MRKLLSLTVVLVMIMTVLPPAGIVVSAAGTGAEALSISGTEALYSEYDYSDPNWVTDEQMFGKWDATTEEWTTEPILNYVTYEAELEEVIKAAKAGDYELAKQKITDYYREKFLNQPRAITKTNTTTAIIAARMACYNMYGMTSFTNLDIVTLTESESLHKADITSIAQSASTSTSGKEFSFQIAATHDDGYIGYILSRESGNGAYVEANVDGNNMTFPVIADTYIRGGEYKDINYGTTETNPENKLYIAEHADFSNSKVCYPAKTFTRSDVKLDGIMRTRLTVDFSELNAGSTVNSAKLCFTGASDAPSGKTVVIQYKADMSGKETDTSWTWSGAPRYLMSYHGFPGTVGFAGDNSTKYDRYVAANWAAATSLTGVYRYTMDETYAYHAFRYMMALVNEQGYNPLVASRGSGTWENNLSCATRSAAIPEQLAQLATSKYFTAETFVPMLKYAYSSGQALVDCWDSQSETTNWGTYETAGLSNLVVNFKEFSIVDAEMEEGGYGNGKKGGWLRLVNHRYYIISGEVLRPDNSFTETMGYGKETFNNFLKYPKYADMAGEPVYLDEPLMQNMNKLAAYIINVSRPGFTSTQYGDSYAFGAQFHSVALDAAKLTGDPFLEWAGNEMKSGTPPEHTSIFYPDNRKLISRTGWGLGDLMIDFAADNTVMGHNHPDDLNINMFCYGEPLLVDSMQYSYGTNAPERNAVYATANHNTLSIKITDPNTGYRENLSHVQNISGIYSGPYPVYSEFLPKENWPNAWFSRMRTAEPGVVHRSELNNGYDYTEMSHTNYENWVHTNSDYDYAYSNVNMKRSLFVQKDAKYMLVTDYVKALDDKEYTVAQNWHFLPSSAFTLDENTGVAETHFSGANVQVVPVFAQSQMDAVYEKEGYYCRTQGVIQNNPYPAYEKHGSGDKVFNTLILPTASGKDIETKAINLPMDVEETVATASRITMTDKDLDQTTEVNYYFLHDARQKSQRVFGGYSADAKMAVVEKIGTNPSMLVLQDGTNISNTTDKKVLLKSLENVEELSVRFVDGSIKIDSSKDIDLESLTIRSEDSVNAVFLNNEQVKFNQANNYVYFNETPILADEEEEEEGEQSGGTSTGTHGSPSGGSPSGGSPSGGSPSGGKDNPPVTEPDNPPAASDSFKEELSGHWGEEEIKSLVNTGIVKGDDKGKLNLKNSVTRAELLTLLVRALDIEEKTYDSEFADVTKDDWYAGVISAAKAAGLVDGADGRVMPNDTVTREQMAKFLVTAYKLTGKDKEEGDSISFTDSADVSQWAAEYVEQATKLGILNGMGDGTFAPKGAVLREQAFAAISRLLK